MLQNAAPPSKLPKVRNDLGQFAACGRGVEREGGTLMVPPHTPPPPRAKVFIIVTIFFYFAAGPSCGFGTELLVQFLTQFLRISTKFKEVFDGIWITEYDKTLGVHRFTGIGGREDHHNAGFFRMFRKKPCFCIK